MTNFIKPQFASSFFNCIKKKKKEYLRKDKLQPHEVLSHLLDRPWQKLRSCPSKIIL